MDDCTPAGLGIGLAIARALTELQGGSLTAHSEGEDRGSTFTVRIPMRPKEEADDSADAILPPFRARTIVIVDDNRDAADSLALFLAARGHRVNVTYEGWKGLQLISELQPKIGIPDLHLPGVRP